jgi:hypothetical protein
MLFLIGPESDIREAAALLCIACFPFDRLWQGQFNSRVCAHAAVHFADTGQANSICQTGRCARVIASRAFWAWLRGSSAQNAVNIRSTEAADMAFQQGNILCLISFKHRADNTNTHLRRFLAHCWRSGVMAPAE